MILRSIAEWESGIQQIPGQPEKFPLMNSVSYVSKISPNVKTSNKIVYFRNWQNDKHSCVSIKINNIKTKNHGGSWRFWSSYLTHTALKCLNETWSIKKKYIAFYLNVVADSLCLSKDFYQKGEKTLRAQVERR